MQRLIEPGFGSGSGGQLHSLFVGPLFYEEKISTLGKMNPKTIIHHFSYFVIMAILSGVFSCNMPPQVTTRALPLNPSREQASSLPAIDTLTPKNYPTVISIPPLTATSIPIPKVTLKKGDFYFSIDDRQSFLYSRNVAGSVTSNYNQFLGWTGASGSKFVHIHLDPSPMTRYVLADIPLTFSRYRKYLRFTPSSSLSGDLL